MKDCYSANNMKTVVDLAMIINHSCLTIITLNI